MPTYLLYTPKRKPMTKARRRPKARKVIGGLWPTLPHKMGRSRYSIKRGEETFDWGGSTKQYPRYPYMGKRDFTFYR